MANGRKRVHAVRRAADGSAFKKCDQCGVSVAIALADMHECEPDKKGVKRFRGHCASNDFNGVSEWSAADQPRSAFCFFMENLRETSKEESYLDIDRKGFEMWKNMSDEERRPYLIQAIKVNGMHFTVMLDEEKNMRKSKVEDGADSVMVRKFDKFLEHHEDHDDSDSYGTPSISGSYEWEWSFGDT